MRLIMSTLAALLVLSACVVERNYSDERLSRDRDSPFLGGGFNDDEFEGDEFEDEWQDSYSELNVGNGRVTGDLGNVTSFDAPANNISSYAESEWSNVTLEAYDGANRMGMIILDISGFDLRSAPAGRYVFTSYSVEGPGTDAGDTVWVTGCSSGNDDSYDAPAEEGEVIISDEPAGDRTVEVQATLPSADYGSTTQATGSFTLSL